VPRSFVFLGDVAGVRRDAVMLPVVQCVAVCVAVCCSVLQCVLQGVAVPCSFVLQGCGVTTDALYQLKIECYKWWRCSVLQCVLQGVAGCCSVLQCVAMCCSALLICFAGVRRDDRCVVPAQNRVLQVGVLQCVAVCVAGCCSVCCSVLQCVAMCCSVLQ